MKPRHIWIIAAICLALLCGAMAWATHSMLGMERDQNRMAAEAGIQEMARLALWRMESIASALVIEESARPPEHYRTFAEPEAVLDNKTYASVKQGDLLTLSPLLREPSDHVRLYFEMDAAGVLRSPQVPVGRELMICQATRTPAPEVIAGCSMQLDALRGFMDNDSGGEGMKALRATLKAPPSLTGNRLWLWSNNGEPESLAGALANTGAGQKNESRPVQQLVASIPGLAQQSANWKEEVVQAQQSELNTSEAQARAVILEAGKDKALARRAFSNNYESARKGEAQQKAQTVPNDAGGVDPLESKLNPVPPPGSTPTTGSPEVVRAAAFGSYPAISDFRPYWMGEALLLTRRVAEGGREWIQGAWLDWEKLRGEMRAAVEDRFPGAQIVRAPEDAAPGAHLLVSLPVELIPGAVSFAPLPFWSPLKMSLGIAWLCVLLAVAAVALVLRSMMALSERRASFVSSVTHELRTPLATFKLYSEMLADGMVKEEAKRQQYLETLTGEADRLGHLVENVLAYSRIERGRRPAAAAPVPAGDLIRRIEPRLNQRALMAGMDFSVSASPDVMAMALRTDAGAVEQILCNLVDNACKYGRRDGVPGRVELIIVRERRRICFGVRDYGPGIDRGEEKKLFLPFHKSAREAAHSKPGVGLGLALCRRLAAELRGSMEIDRTWRQGASFVLRLPV